MSELLHILFYDYVSDVLERRPPLRERHLDLLRARESRGEVLKGGALGDPPQGAAIVFTSAEAAHDFAAEDPYVDGGLVTEWRVVPWTVVVG